MKNITLSIGLMLAISTSSFAKIWVVTNAGNTFTPATITIRYGDTVSFAITSAHDAREVSASTWNNKENLSLPGGFQTAFGGGMVLPALLFPGTHYYVCTPHASMGMRGQIIVENKTTDIADNNNAGTFRLYPSPASEILTISSDAVTAGEAYVLYDMTGHEVLQGWLESNTAQLDIRQLQSGVYFLHINAIRKSSIKVVKQ